MKRVPRLSVAEGEKIDEEQEVVTDDDKPATDDSRFQRNE
jgi:hypothetical protein